MRRVLAGFALIVIAAIAAVAVRGDGRYRTIVFAPVAANGWREPPPLVCGKGCTKFVNCDWPFADPLRCWIYPRDYAAAWHLKYEDSRVRIVVNDSDLKSQRESLSGYWDGFTPAALNGHVLIPVSVMAKDPNRLIDLSRVHIARPCDAVREGKGGGPAIAYFRYESARILPFGSMPFPQSPGLQFGALLLRADAANLRTCGLDFSAAIGEPIPILRFKAVPVAFYKPIF
ncbi:MAG TPA: hypothetical protein VNU97_14140 [Rhizomicrobium sp.]|jgi:hypothetical protein|nr:hypothetical protein [Rhizomicrobium sp.]